MNKLMAIFLCSLFTFSVNAAGHLALKITPDGKQTFNFVIQKSDVIAPATEIETRDRLLGMKLGQKQACLKGYKITERIEDESVYFYTGKCK